MGWLGRAPREPGVWAALGRSRAEEGACTLQVRPCALWARARRALLGPAPRAALLSPGSFWSQHLVRAFLLLTFLDKFLGQIALELLTNRASVFSKKVLVVKKKIKIYTYKHFSYKSDTKIFWIESRLDYANAI